MTRFGFAFLQLDHWLLFRLCCIGMGCAEPKVLWHLPGYAVMCVHAGVYLYLSQATVSHMCVPAGFNLISQNLLTRLNESNCYWTTNGYAAQSTELLPVADLSYPYDYESDQEPSNAANGLQAHLHRCLCSALTAQTQSFAIKCLPLHGAGQFHSHLP